MAFASDQQNQDNWDRQTITKEEILTAQTVKKVHQLYINALSTFNQKLIFKVDEFCAFFQTMFDHHLGNYLKRAVIACLGYEKYFTMKFSKTRTNEIIYVGVLNSSPEAQKIQNCGLNIVKKKKSSTTDTPNQSKVVDPCLSQVFQPEIIAFINAQHGRFERLKKAAIESKGQTEYVTPKNKRNILNADTTSQPISGQSALTSSIEEITSDDVTQMNQELNMIQSLEVDEAKTSVVMTEINESLSASLYQNANVSYLIEYNKVSALYESLGKLWHDYYQTKSINAAYISNRSEHVLTKGSEHVPFRDFIIGRQKYLAPSLNMAFAIPTESIHAAFHKNSKSNQHWKATALGCVCVIMCEYVKTFDERRNWGVYETGRIIKMCNDLAKALQEINFQQTGYGDL